MAMAIKTGIETYLLQNPIPNTIFSTKVSGIQYIAKPGDTIASIAAKYRISVNSLKNINVFQNNVVVAGQVVRIPTQNNS
jgi:LysM repeat protein